jgi:glutamate carboxypeptidase
MPTSKNQLSITAFQQRLPALIELIRQFVEIESPTTDKEAVDRLGRLVQEQMQTLGGRIKRFPQAEVGDHVLARWGSDPQGILLLTHLDTVYPQGTLARMPWEAGDKYLVGPGVLDMKASVALALMAIQALIETQSLPARSISLLCTSDEETGSQSSAALIQELASQHSLVLCLEAGLPDGALKTWRKGTGTLSLTVHGKASHAGGNPNEGINAILEMAYQIPRLIALADELTGTTLNPGVIHGGTRSNVVPARCSLKIDVRVRTPEERTRLDRALLELKPVQPDAELDFSLTWNRPPMPRGPHISAAFERAKSIAAGIGLTLTEGGTGGASDANFVAPLGIPVLDGLGPVGLGAHSAYETVNISSLAQRAALLSALLRDW